MPQDIKTFSDLLDIDPQLDISITIKVHGLVAGAVYFNEQPCHEGVNHFTAGLRESLHLISTITHFDEGTSAIEIVDFTVNGYNVIPTYQHLSSTGNGYHDFCGSWSFLVIQPFYPWYHQVSGQGWIA
jgi:hypothetical protein